MRLLTKLVCSIFILSLLISYALAQPAKENNVIFQAVEDEMNRAKQNLKFKDFDKPYFLEYIVEDADILAIQASFGAITNSSQNKTRILYTQVRVGDYELDNAGRFGFKLPFPMPVDDNYNALRRSVWSVTDRSYKQAINIFESIKARKRNQTEDEEDKVPSFSKEKPIVSIKSQQKIDVDKKKWEDQVRKWSAMFRSYPEFRNSTFNFYVRQVDRYLINTEGTKVLKPEFLITVDIHATAVTAENTIVSPYRHIFATSFDELPPIEKINKEIEAFKTDLEEFKKAKPFKDTYIGPALFTEGASVQLFLQLLSPNLRDGDFTDRIGRKVLPSFLSVYDDPTMTKFGSHKLAGNYKIDDEGVEAKPLTLIENGVLKTLLMTRAPNKKIKNSNGRARNAGVRGSTANISNLIVKSKDGKSFAELKKQLIEECKKQGLEYGIIFRENNSTFGTFSSSSSLIVHKVYVEDGREEIFREASIVDLTVRELRNILASGNDPYPFNLLLNSSYNGTGIPASVVAPTVLLEEIYLKKSRSVKVKPRLLKHPFFNN